jgi:hypothetical protein
MHLIFTASYDVTTDMIVDRLGDRALRVNNDRPHDHEFQIGPAGFAISDPYGRRVTDANLVTAILRKPAPRSNSQDDQEIHAFRELSSAHVGLLQLIAHKWPGKLPIHPSKIRDIVKFVQLDVAKPFFPTAPWCFTTRPDKCAVGDDAVLKSLHGMPFTEAKDGADPKYIYVQNVKPSELAEGWPWFLQERIEARFDVTVLYVDGLMFAQRLDRNSFNGLDWRKHIGTDTDNHWEHVVLPTGLSQRIDAYMRKLGLRFGRLDFLTPDEDLESALFLEVNPNGQWAWMDLQMKNGVFDAVIEFLCRPIKA